MSSNDLEAAQILTWESHRSFTEDLLRRMMLLNAALANKLNCPADMVAAPGNSKALLAWASMARLCSCQMTTLSAQLTYIEAATDKWSNIGMKPGIY